VNGPIQLRSLRALVWRYPLKTPVVTSFGTMHDRPMVLVRAEDANGIAGWGEIWCNFPQVGAEHRARIVHGVLAPLAISRPFDDPAALFEFLTAQTAVLALQAGEPGPFAQAIAGVDLALWDLWARRSQQPLWRLLGGSTPRVRVYASGLNPDRPSDLAATRRNEGFRAFKLKIGFGRDRDLANVAAVRSALGEQAKKLNVTVPQDLPHAMIFFTTGEAVRSIAPDHVPTIDRLGLWTLNLSGASLPASRLKQPLLDTQPTHRSDRRAGVHASVDADLL